MNKSNWISINDALPGEGENILIFSNDVIYIGFLFYGFNEIDSLAASFRDQYDNFDIEHVSHWQPLPEPPEGEYL